MWRTKCRDVLIPCMWFAVLWPNKFCYSTLCFLIYLFFAMNINQYGIHMEEYTDPHNNIHLRNVESSHHSLKFLKDSFPPGSCHLPCLWCEVIGSTAILDLFEGSGCETEGDRWAIGTCGISCSSNPNGKVRGGTCRDCDSKSVWAPVSAKDLTSLGVPFDYTGPKVFFSLLGSWKITNSAIGM